MASATINCYLFTRHYMYSITIDLLWMLNTTRKYLCAWSSKRTQIKWFWASHRHRHTIRSRKLSFHIFFLSSSSSSSVCLMECTNIVCVKSTKTDSPFNIMMPMPSSKKRDKEKYTRKRRRNWSCRRKSNNQQYLSTTTTVTFYIEYG